MTAPGRACAVIAAVTLAASDAAAPAGYAPADRLGPYPAGDFVVTTGDASPIAPAPKLYFAKEWIAVPRDDVPVSAYQPGVSAADDVRAWASSQASGEVPGARPPLVWLAAPERVTVLFRYPAEGVVGEIAWVQQGSSWVEEKVEIAER